MQWSTRLRRRDSRWLAVVTLLLAIGVSLADGLLTGTVASERDTTDYYYPLYLWVWRQIHLHGQFPFWAPEIFSGYPIFADGEIGLANPAVLLSLVALPPELGFVLLRLFHLAVAALGAYSLARVWRLSASAATLAGLVFALGSFLQGQIHHENVVRTAAWLPAALALVELALRRSGAQRRVHVALAGLAIGMASLGLHTQILAIDLVGVGAYGFVRLWVGPIRGAGRSLPRRLGSVASVVAGTAALGLLVGAVQVVPLMEMARYSPRGEGLPYGEAAAYSLTPHSLVQLLFPFFFRAADLHQWTLWTHWEQYLYVGLVPLVLALLALVGSRRRIVLGWGALAAGGVILALGQYSPVNLHYLFWLLPGLGGLRAPGRFALIAVLALSLLAAHGLSLLERRARVGPSRACRPSLTRILQALAALPLALAISLGLGHLALRAEPNAARVAISSTYLSLPHDTYRLTAADVYDGLLWSTDVVQNPWTRSALLGLLAVSAGLLLWQHGPLPRLRAWRGWPAALVLATALDLLSFGWLVHPRDSLVRLAEPPPAVRLVSQQTQARDPDGVFRVLVSPALVDLAPNRLAPHGVEALSGYSSLVYSGYRDLLARIRQVDDDLLDLVNVRYVLEPARYGILSSYRGVDFLSSQALLRAPRDSALGTETFRVPPDVAVAEVRLVASLVDAVEIAQDAPVAEVVLRGPEGDVVARQPVLAGRDVMEWAADDPAVRPWLQHGHVEVAAIVQERTSRGQNQPRLLSFARLRLERPTPAATMEVRSLQPRGELAVYGAALVDSQGDRHQLFGRQKTKYREVYRDAGVAVYENLAAFPRAFLVPRARVAPGPEEALRSMAHQPFDPSEEVVLGREPPSGPEQATGTTGRATRLEQAIARGAVGDGTARLLKHDPHTVAVAVSTPDTAYLVLTDAYYPGWRALVDGQEVPILRGDAVFRVVQVPAGAHRVVFEFDPSSARLGLAVTGLALAGAAIVLGGVVVGGRRRAR